MIGTFIASPPNARMTRSLKPIFSTKPNLLRTTRMIAPPFMTGPVRGTLSTPSLNEIKQISSVISSLTFYFLEIKDRLGGRGGGRARPRRRGGGGGGGAAAARAAPR